MHMMYRVTILLSATLLNCTTWIWDIKQAYQKYKPLQHDVYTHPSKEAKIQTSNLLKI